MTSAGYMTSTPQKHADEWSLPLAGFEMWSSDMPEPPLLELGFIEPGLRRKLSPVAKQALSLAYRCSAGYAQTRVVFASRHGDINRTTGMLLQMLNNDAPSPTAFSMSVLNATVGAFSIATQNQAPSTAISANNSSLGFGLIEALMQFKSQPDSPLLFIYADEPPPEIYAADVPGIPAHAMALLFVENAKQCLQFGMQSQTLADSAEAQSLAFMHSLQTGTGSWHGEARTWHWSLHAS